MELSLDQLLCVCSDFSAPLKYKMGFLQSDNKSKAEILNEQFQSVFTKENLNKCQNKRNNPYQTMSDWGNSSPFLTLALDE
jgi:hypothetical protein